jgi:uncharacterized protein YndB with AHSA1/START domain
MPDERMVRKRIEIGRSQETAFRLFTEQMAEWWPLESHSISGDSTVDVVVEPQAGGEIYERDAAGRTAHWATILEWDPPRRLRVRWRPSPEGNPETTWEVRFVVLDGGSTRVELDHWGWERFGAQADDVESEYVVGWDLVLGRFSSAAGAERATP